MTQDQIRQKISTLVRKYENGGYTLHDVVTAVLESCKEYFQQPSPSQPARTAEEREPQSVHDWFELSYAQYLTVPRSIMEAMSEEWQHKMTALLNEVDETFNWRPSEGRYWVQLKDDKGRYVKDPLMQYRHPDLDYIQSLRKTFLSKLKPGNNDTGK